MERQKARKQFEQYQDAISRLYPELHGSNRSGREEQLHGKDRILTRNVTFQVTDYCNLRCTYCYQINKKTRMMSKETARKYIDLLLSGDKGFSDYVDPSFSPAIILEFIGGEPFTNVEVIDYACTYFMKRAIELHHPWAKNFMISICSNGTLYFTPEVQAFLKKWKHKMSFSVTIDGDKKLHDSCRIFPDGSGSYDLAVAAAKDWMAGGQYMGSKITIAPGNIDHVSHAIQHMVEMGYEEINCNCVYEKGWTEEHATKLYYQLKEACTYLMYNNLEKKIYVSIMDDIYFVPKSVKDTQTWCGGLGDMLSCDPDGYLYPCIRYMESSLGSDRPPVRIGHVDTGICQCDEEKCTLCDLCGVNRRTYNTDECFYCPIAAGCADCAAYNYQDSGTFYHRATYICEMHKARALVNAWYWGKYYEKYEPHKKFKLYVPDDWALKIIPQEELDMIKALPNVELCQMHWEDVKKICDEHGDFTNT